MNNVDRKIKLYGIILGVILFIGLVAGLTYAALTWRSSNIVISGDTDCLEIDSAYGSDITGSDLLLQDENDIISGNTITIKKGMVLTNVTAKIKSTCTLGGYLTLSLNVTSLNSAFTTTGNSTGALKYAVVKYNPSTYTSISTTSLLDESFTIENTDSITSTGNIIIKEKYLSSSETTAYLIIFYIDGDLANNDLASNTTNFEVTLKGSVTQSTEVTSGTNLATYITNLYNSSNKIKVVNNGITYNYAELNNLMNDRYGSMSTNIDSGNIRYYGSSPNNYIYFNCSDYSNQTSDTCELWRIIGVFNGKVKIMRNSSIGAYSWDNKDTTTGAETDYGKNDWSDARLMRLLNSGYESESVGGSLYWNAGSGSCYSGRSNDTTTCNFTSTGLKNATTRNLISESTYSLLGHNSPLVYTDVMYNRERTTGSVYSTTPARSTSWTGKVALAYPSDYGYAADLSKCNQTLYNYYNSTCTSNNWMKNVITNNGSNFGWFLTPHSGSSYSVWYVNSGGNAYNDNAHDAWAVAPVLYLNSKQAIGSGNGSNNLPFQLTVT